MSQELDFHLIATSKNNLKEIHTSCQSPKITSLSHNSLLILHNNNNHKNYIIYLWVHLFPVDCLLQSYFEMMGYFRNSLSRLSTSCVSESWN